jgi:Domain of unknown function (DUF4214)
MRFSGSRLTRGIMTLAIGVTSVVGAVVGGRMIAGVASTSAISAGSFDVVVQTMDSCKTGLSGAAYRLSGPGGTFSVGAQGAPSPASVGTSPTCPLQQGNCSSASQSCLVFASVPAGDYRLTETATPGPDSSNPAGYAPCEGGSACQWEAADVTVNTDGSVLGRVSNMYPNGSLVTWPSGSLYRGTAADPIVFHDFGMAKPGTPGDKPCDGNGDASDWSTGTPSSECHPTAAALAACPNSPAPHFPWSCLTDPNAVQHLGSGPVVTSPQTTQTSQASFTTFVGNLYHDVLGRRTAPSASETGYWTGLLAGGTSRAQVAADLVGSDEAHGDLVDADYQLLLGRAADPGGRAYWTSQLDNGAYNETVEAVIAGGSEFHAKHGGTDAGFVTALYTDLLHRTPQPSEVNAWLAGGPITNRTAVARAFAFGHEDHGDLVAGWYQRYLGRKGDPGGLAYWTAYLDQGNRDDAAVVNLTASNEYFGDASRF